MTRPRVVLDTNVVLSAVLCGGNPAEFFALCLDGRIELYVSPFLVEELERILNQKFHWKDTEIGFLKKWYLSITKVVYPSRSVNLIKRKDSDNRVLESALEARAHYLVTGDKRDLLPLREFEGIRIVSPIEGLAIINP